MTRDPSDRESGGATAGGSEPSFLLTRDLADRESTGPADRRPVIVSSSRPICHPASAKASHLAHSLSSLIVVEMLITSNPRPSAVLTSAIARGTTNARERRAPSYQLN
jgi:hypothetical protein